VSSENLSNNDHMAEMVVSQTCQQYLSHIIEGTGIFTHMMPLGAPAGKGVVAYRREKRGPTSWEVPKVGIWMFPKIVGFPPKSSLKKWDFPLFSPSILGCFPIFGNTHISTSYGCT